MWYGISYRLYRMLRSDRGIIVLRLLSLLGLVGITLAACAPPAYTVKSQPVTNPPQPSIQLYFYPKHGQTKEQQDRDRYECYLWAVKQSGFDPGQAQAPHQRIEVTPVSPPGANTAAGAMGGAIAGSILASPHNTGEGMVFGAITGAMLGAASEASQQQQAEQLQQHYNAQEAQHYARIEQQARNYRRAMTACLEGRGYEVK
jgi:hypothetical protein